MKRYPTLVTARLEPEALAELEPYCDMRFSGWVEKGSIFSPQEILPHLEGVEVFIDGYEKVTEEMLTQLPQLRFIACCRGNPVNIDVKAAARRGIPVVYTPGRNANGVAEFTIGLMLAATRHIPQVYHVLKEGEYLAPPGGDLWEEAVGDVVWDTPGENLHTTYGGYELEGRTLGVIGFGHIGRLVAKKASALGMKVLAYDPYCVDGGGLGELVSLEELLEQSDLVTLHCKVTADNHHLLGKREFSRMKPSAILINTARASLVDPQALVKALESGRIAGAALDVFWKEPLAADHPLLQMDQVLVTPHIAGASLDVTRIQSRMIVEDVLNWVHGRELKRQAH